MLTNLDVSNFKSWKHLELNLKPITGLFGSNSSGKSSVLQFLLLLKQTKEATDRSIVLDFGSASNYTNLGSYKDAIYKHKENLNLTWDLSWTLPDTIKITHPEEHSRKTLFEIDELTQYANVYKQNKNLGLEYISYSFGDVEIDYEEGNRGYELNISGTNYRFTRTPGRVWELPQPIKTHAFPDQVLTYFQNTGFLTDLVLEYETMLDRTYYLGPLRDYPKREYLWSGVRPVDVGRKGEKVVEALLSARADGEKRNLAPKKHYRPFEEFIADWLQRIGLIHSFKVREIGKESGLFRVYVKKDQYSAEALITDVGFGVSQILPVIVLLYYVPQKSVVLLEQPEIHLHPAVQSGLADIIINAVQTRNIQVIIESHSEHLLKRLQRRIAEEVIESDQIGLHFFKIENGKSIKTELEIDQYGNISNWPEDFFGDEFGEISAMQEAAIKRKIANKKRQ